MRQGSFNQTAYRILLLLQWLSQKPMTFQEINSRFKSEPNVGRSISQDTFWLYMNTLKNIGCDISRPTPSNGYCYELNGHPFRYFLSSQDIDFLKEILCNLNSSLDCWTVFYFLRWMKRMILNAPNKNREELLTQLFSDLRIADVTEAFENLMRDLESHCQEHQLIRIDYNSSTNGLRQIDFLPQKLFHHQCTFYVLGHSAERDNSCMLRLDKIENAVPVSNPDLHGRLLEKQRWEEVFLIRILNCSLKQYEPLGNEDEVLVDPTSNEHLLVTLKTGNEFLLSQKLLTSGYRFQVLYPDRFRKNLQNTLSEMRLLYLQ